MRACLFALLFLFCLPLQWAGATTDAPCLQDPCAALHAGVAGASLQADPKDQAGDSHAQHPHCVTCHAGALALLSDLPFSLSDTGSRAQARSRSWTDGLFVERPERPQWPTLA